MLWQVDLPVGAQDSGKEAIICCCNNHCSIDGQFLLRGTQGCTSAVGKTEIVYPLI